MDIGLIGKAQAGKDSVGAILRESYGYQRVAFADALKESALRANPLIYPADGWLDYGYCEEADLYLADLVHLCGWDAAKVGFPEVRRFLQQHGQAKREHDPEYWIHEAMRVVDDTSEPVVVTDVRYRNEAETLAARGFLLVRVVRPGVPLGEAYSRHLSETDLDDWTTPVTIMNAGSLADLRQSVERVMDA